MYQIIYDFRVKNNTGIYFQQGNIGAEILVLPLPS